MGQVASRACETRGVWLNPRAFNSEAQRASTLKSISDGNFNTVFLIGHPLTNQYGLNNGWSSETNFKAMLLLLRNNGIGVHVWLLNNRRVAGTTADMADPSEQHKQVEWAISWLSSYPELDGVHFDYIRYPESGPIHKDRLAGVSQTVRLAHQRIHETFPNKALTAAVRSTHRSLADYNTEYIPPWFTDWLASHPANSWDQKYVPSFLKVQQDPVTWLSNNWIDFAIPMMYTGYYDYFKFQVDHWVSFRNQETKGLLAGISWLSRRGTTPTSVVRQIRYARSQGWEGVSIFELGNPYNRDDGPLVRALTIADQANNNDPPFTNKIPSCLAARF